MPHLPIVCDEEYIHSLAYDSEQFNFKKEPKHFWPQGSVIWEVLCKHLVFLEEKVDVLKGTGDAFHIQVTINGLSRATTIAYLKPLHSCRKERLLPGIVLREHCPWHPADFARKEGRKEGRKGKGRKEGRLFQMLFCLKGERGCEEDKWPAWPHTRKSQKHQSLPC